MAEKLRSISKRIHWSLILRALIFTAAWLLLPFWLFFFVALYLYFVPFFQSSRLAIPFFALVLLCLFTGSSVAFGIIFGLIFYLILLIKDLIVIDRRPAYEVVVLALSFFLFRELYMRFPGGATGGALFSSLFAALVFALLLGSFIDCFKGDALSSEEILRPEGIPRVAKWLSFVLIWQALAIGLFLPLNFIYQSAVVFLVAVLLIEFVPGYLSGNFSRNQLITTSSVIFTLFVVVLGLAHWGF